MEASQPVTPCHLDMTPSSLWEGKILSLSKYLLLSSKDFSAAAWSL